MRYLFSHLCGRIFEQPPAYHIPVVGRLSNTDGHHHIYVMQTNNDNGQYFLNDPHIALNEEKEKKEEKEHNFLIQKAFFNFC